MRKTLLTPLMVGVLSSTFLLVNCDKKPNRLSKSSTDGKTQKEKADDRAKVWVDCSNEFIKKYRISKDLVQKLSAQKTDDLNPSQTEELKKRAQDAGEKTDETIAEITKIKTDADGCKAKDPKTKQATTRYLIGGIRNEVDQVLINLMEKAKITVPQTEKAKINIEKNAKKSEANQTRNSLDAGIDLIISNDFAEASLPANKEANAVFIGGSILKVPDDIIKHRTDKTKTICKIEKIAPDDSVLKGSQKVKVITTEWLPKDENSEDTRRTYSVTFGQGGNFATIYCLIAETKEKNVNTEIRSAFGTHLQSEAQTNASIGTDPAMDKNPAASNDET